MEEKPSSEALDAIFEVQLSRATRKILDPNKQSPSRASYARRITGLIMSGEIKIQPLTGPEREKNFAFIEETIPGYEEEGVINRVEVRPNLVKRSQIETGAGKELFDILCKAVDRYDQMVNEGKHVLTNRERAIIKSPVPEKD